MALGDGARTVIDNCLAIKKGEQVLVVSDTDMRVIGHVLFKAAKDAGAEVIHMEMLTRDEHGQEPPSAVAQAMKSAGAVILSTTYSMTHTAARREANRKGARVVSMPGVTLNQMSNGGMTADYRQISKDIRRVSKYIVGSKQVEIRSENGTDLKLDVKGRDWVLDDDGLCFKKGTYTTLPAGEVFVAPIESSAEGTLIIDGYFGKLLETPVEMTLTKGIAVKIKYAPHFKETFERYGRSIVTLSKIGVGFNPRSLFLGDPAGDIKKLGTVNIGFGSNVSIGGRIYCPLKPTGVLQNATLIIDGRKIVESGNFAI
jgi:leucyl aminopeptidase (aminopeptidase T)